MVRRKPVLRGNGKRHYLGKPPRPKGTGTYRRCRIGALGLRDCPGYHLTKNGVPYGHRRCGGDGWIKIDDRNPRDRKRRRPGAPGGGGGRARRPRRPRGTGRSRRRVAGTTVAAGGAWAAADQLVGVVGTTIVVVVYGLLLTIKLLASGLILVTELTADRRRAATA